MHYIRKRIMLPQKQDNFDGFVFSVFPPNPPSPPPPPPPCLSPPTPPHHGPYNGTKKELLETGLTITACMIGAALLIAILCKIFMAKRFRERNLRRERSGPIIFSTQEDFADGDQGPEIDHHIWYINTVGLQQSVIDSISVFRYKKDEALIEGTECSVCLSEFQEDESLRLLPKCSHAFHLSCIDTWLRSHKNCPLCRAPIVSCSFGASVGLSVPSTNESSSREGPQMENSENSGAAIRNEVVGDIGSSEVRDGAGIFCGLPIEDETNDGGDSKIDFIHSILRDHSGVRSDLVETGESMESETQPVRRSVSWNSSSALAINNAVAVIAADTQQGSSNGKSPTKNWKSKSKVKRRSGGSLSFRKLMIGSSVGLSLQKKGPMSMRRSFSTSKSQDSILPL